MSNLAYKDHDNKPKKVITRRQRNNLEKEAKKTVKKVIKNNRRRQTSKQSQDNLIDIQAYRSQVKNKTANSSDVQTINGTNVNEPEAKISAKYKTKTGVLVDKILRFCMALTGVTLFPYQVSFAKRIIKAVLTNDSSELTALFSRQSGKSETMSVVVAGLMVILPVLANTPAFMYDDRFTKYREGFWAGVFAPSQRQSKFVFGRIRSYLDGSTTRKSNASTQILEELGIEFSTNNGENVVISTPYWSSKVGCITASDNAKIEGESLHFILFDETQDISDFIISKSVMPMGSFYNASVVMIGTPTTRKGYFYEAIQLNLKKYKASKQKVKNHFQYDWRTVAKYNRNYYKTVEKEIEKGKHRDEFRMSYELEWILNREMFLTEAVLRDKVWDEDLAFVPADTERTHVVGIDLGKSRDDTVVTVVEPDWMNPVIHEVARNTADGGFNEQYTVYKFKVKDVLRIEGDDWDTQYTLIMDYLKNFKISRIVMDSTGVGSPMYDRMRVNLPEVEVVPFAFSTSSKSDLYKHFTTELGAGRISYPYADSIKSDHRIREFHQQAIDMEKSYSGTYMVCSHPDRRGAKDDFVDSLALACWAVRSAEEVVSVDSVHKKQIIVPTLKQRNRNRYTSRRRNVGQRGNVGRQRLVYNDVESYVHAYDLAGGQ